MTTTLLSTDMGLLVLRGLFTTVTLTICSAALAIVAAFALGLLQVTATGPVRIAATVFIEFWRGSSAIVQLFVAFYALPAFGITLPPFAVGVVVLGLNVGAYGSQVVRAAIESVPAGQREAALALGLRPSTVMAKVVLPQALPEMLPSFGNESVELLKMTAATSLITLHDLSSAAKEIVQRDPQPVLIYSGLLGLYFLLALPLIGLTLHLEKRVRGRGSIAARSQA